MFKKGRYVALAAAAALSVSGLVAVAPAEAATKNIIVWTDEERGPSMKALLVSKTPVKGFKIVIKVFASLDALNTAWSSATAASGPDVVISNAGLAASGGKSGKLLALTIPAAVKKQFGPKAFQALGYGGKAYGVPLDVDTTAFFWNKTLFGTKAPATFKAMVDWYKANKNSKGLTAGFCAQEGEWGVHPVLTALGGGAWKYTKGGDPVPNSTALANAAFKANVKALLMTNGSSNGFLKVGGECINDFKAGKIPFMNTGGWNIGGIKSSGVKYKMGRVPGLKAGTYGSPWAGYQAAYVAKFATNHGVATGAKTFVISFMSNSTVQAQLSILGNRPPANVVAATKVNDPVLKAIALAGSGGILQLSAMLDNTASGASWYGTTGEMWNQLLNTEDPDVDAILDATAAKVTQNFVAANS